MTKAAASTSSHKSSSPAAALVRSRNTLTFRLHPKQLIAFRSKATEILYRGAAGGGKPHLPRAAASRGIRKVEKCRGSAAPPHTAVPPRPLCYSGLGGDTLRGRPPLPRFRT